MWLGKTMYWVRICAINIVLKSWLCLPETGFIGHGNWSSESISSLLLGMEIMKYCFEGFLLVSSALSLVLSAILLICTLCNFCGGFCICLFNLLFSGAWPFHQSTPSHPCHWPLASPYHYWLSHALLLSSSHIASLYLFLKPDAHCNDYWLVVWQSQHWDKSLTCQKLEPKLILSHDKPIVITICVRL